MSAGFKTSSLHWRKVVGVVLAGVSLTAGCIPVPLLGKRDQPSVRTLVGGRGSSMPIRPGATREAVLEAPVGVAGAISIGCTTSTAQQTERARR